MQSFGNGMNFGGPGLGFFATRKAFLRQIPGPDCGATVDNGGQRGFVLTLSTREQHIRRENATSNICTNNGLNALAATMHLAILGKRGLHELALLNWRRAKYARERMVHAARFSGPTFNEFVVRVKPGAYQRAHDADDPGLELGAFDPALRDCLLLCVTELHDKHQIDLLADALRSDGK